MSSNDRVNVALFIDWDNLAISTAADLGGALPDVRAVVQRAQQYGTLIVAKAYAEWQATSERLSVYRAGVEPVYAPTFRFEPDTPTSQGRGKSLADPCMVADCVDALHLFPDISVYVIVTGDKDMIPVVRLAQLRGRKVIVIGPDYVAGVLREMADEFIPYRSLVEATPARPVAEPRRHAAHATGIDEPVRRRGSERHAPSSFARQERAPIASPVQQAPSPPIAAVTPMLSPAPTPMAPPIRQKPAAEPVEQAPEPVEERVQPEDLKAVFNGIVGILQQRADEGRDRIRATNLKDALMQRMPGFTERKYGFAKFKDLLTSAQRAGLISVTMAGPVHWISLATAPAETKTPVAEVPVVVPAEPAEATAAQLEERRSDLIRFIYELRDRSRWLTYTYVLTNLISYFGKSLSQAAAESRARDTLNYLVQQGILRVDKEPQEVEVGGAKHRVRMCHLNTHHDLVVEALGFTPDEATAERGASVPEGESETSSEGAADNAAIFIAPMAELASPEASTSLPIVEGAVKAGNEDHQVAAAPLSGNGPVAQGDIRAGEEHAVIAQPALDVANEAPTADERPAASIVDAQPMQTDGEREPEAQPAVSSRAMALEAAFAALERVVLEATSGEKPTISASTLRSRLVQAMRSFNERQFGFQRFKDFLLAAQENGVVRVESRGYVTWVSMPRQSTPEAEPRSEAEPES